MLPKLHGTVNERLQVDESYFSDKRKYNRRHLTKGYKRSSREYAARTEVEIELALWSSVQPKVDESSSLDGGKTYRRNYGNQIIGP